MKSVLDDKTTRILAAIQRICLMVLIAGAGFIWGWIEGYINGRYGHH